MTDKKTEMIVNEDSIKKAYEVRDGMTIEEMQAMFFDKSALVEQPERVFRLHKGNDRIYYTVDAKGEPSFFLSVTTLIKRTMPTSPHLIKWIADKGYEEAKEYAKERADYGSFMHAEIGRLLIEKRLDLDTMNERFIDFIERNELPTGMTVHLDEIKKDVLAFAQFMKDHNVRPLAIEIVLTSEDGYAGMVDLVCEMDIEVKGHWGEVYKSGANKGKPKETKKLVTTTAIVDFKSGRKGFYDENSIQLKAYETMWNKHFPDRPIERLFNWSPKDWRTAPSYNLRNWTGHKIQDKFPHLVEIAKIELMDMDSSMKNYKGVIDLTDSSKFDYENNVETITLSEAVRIQKETEKRESKAKQKKAAEEAAKK